MPIVLAAPLVVAVLAVNPVSPGPTLAREDSLSIGETMALAAVHADLAATYAALGDDRGLGYAMRCFAASSKAALQTADLKAANFKGAADGRE